MLRAATIGALLLACAAPATAQVFEVGADGVARDVAAASLQRPAAAKPTPVRPFGEAVDRAAARYGLAPELLDALARQESGYRPGALSPKGAIGVMQLMPGTARALGVDPRDPTANILGGAAYLRAQLDRFDGRVDLALAAYNAGPGAVARHGGVPPYRETQGYVVANLARLARTSLSAPAPDLTQGVDP